MRKKAGQKRGKKGGAYRVRWANYMGKYNSLTNPRHGLEKRKPSWRGGERGRNKC